MSDFQNKWYILKIKKWNGKKKKLKKVTMGKLEISSKAIFVSMKLMIFLLKKNNNDRPEWIQLLQLYKNTQYILEMLLIGTVGLNSHPYRNISKKKINILLTIFHLNLNIS